MKEELEQRVKGLWEDCLCLEETPRPPSDSINGYEYTLEIKAKVPYRTFKNIWYWLTPSFTPERAHLKRKSMVERFGLNNDEVVVYARGHSLWSKP